MIRRGLSIVMHVEEDLELQAGASYEMIEGTTSPIDARRQRSDDMIADNFIADRRDDQMGIDESHAPRMKQSCSHCGHANLSTLHVEQTWTDVARRRRGLPAVNRKAQDHGGTNRHQDNSPHVSHNNLAKSALSSCFLQAHR